jgi:hypothetical protein
MKMICPSRLSIGLCLGVDGRTIRGIGERILADCTRASRVAHQLIDDGWVIGLSGDGDVDGYCDRFATVEEARERLERLGLSHLETSVTALNPAEEEALFCSGCLPRCQA